MSRRSPTVLFVVVTAGLCVLMAYLWTAQPVSNQELLANYSKARDFLSAAQSVKGMPWWSPMFLQGVSLAPAWSFMATNIVMLLFSVPFGFLIGPKVAAMACLAFGALGVFCFLRKYVEDDWCAAIGGTLFLLCPSLLTRTVGYEHFLVGFSMTLLPWAFLGLLVFFRNPSPLAAIFSAVSFASVFLAYGKTGLMALPIFILFGATEFFGRPIERRPCAKLIGLAGGFFFLLAVVPNLPALREMNFVAMFDFGPFSGWQRAFSTKSALGWIDRNGCLTKGIDSSFAPTTANGGTYLGFVAFIFLTIALFLRTLHESVAGKKARTFLTLGLFTFWLSFGPKSVLGGQMEFLAFASHAPNFAPALGWFFLAVQVWVIFRLVPPEWPGAKFLAALFSAIYLVIPGFRLLEILPIYKNIRAPFDFYQVTGTVCVIFAVAIVVRILLGQIRYSLLRSGVSALVFGLAVLDVAPYAKPFFEGPMEQVVFDDFLKTQDFLKASPLPGRVFPFSGRYFYLLTPLLSARPLVTEAFNSYLQQRGAALLQNAAFLSDDQLRAYMRIAGVSHLLVDKTDPDTPREIRERLLKLFPVGFETPNFLVLENKDALAFGFLAQDFIQTGSNAPEIATAALAGARYHLATIELTGVASDELGLRGRIVEGRIEPKSGTTLKEGMPFQRIGEVPGGTYESITFKATGTPGWLVTNQAWHPDWVAFTGATKATIHRAFVAFSAVRTDGKEVVTFHFEPPWWYSLCAMIGIVTWTSCAVIGLMAPFLPASFQKTESPLKKLQVEHERAEIRKPLVVIPTYNEATSITAILEKTLAQSDSLDVLVVDDGSPDGTADLVKTHATYKKRVHLLERDKKTGLGNAYKAGFTWAKTNGYDAVIQMDADLSHDPADIPRLLDALNHETDAAIGSRYLKGVRVINWPEHRLMLSAFASKFVRLATGLPLSDATSGFKALRVTALEGIPANALQAQGYGFQIELHHALWKSGARLIEVPIVFTERIEGKTKMTFSIAIEAFLRVLQLSKR